MQSEILSSKLNESFSRITSLAKEDGAEAELLVEASESLSLSANLGKLEKFDSSQSHVAGLRVLLNGVEGYCWTESLDPSDLESAYREAIENARFAARGRGDGSGHRVELYVPTAVSNTVGMNSVVEDSSLYNDSFSKISMDEKIKRSLGLESHTKNADARISSVPYNSYSESSGEVFVFNTRGVRVQQRRTAISGYAYCLAKQGEEARMAGDSFFTRDASVVADSVIDDVATSAARKAVSKLGAHPPETGNYPIVIDRDVVAELISSIGDYFSAKNVSEKQSIFSKDLGQTIASPLVSLRDDPFLMDGVGNRSFDAEGAPAQMTPVIQKGVLQAFLTNFTYAKKQNLPHTANARRSAKGELAIGASNWVLDSGASSFEELLSAYPRLIYVTDFVFNSAGLTFGSGTFSFQSEGELWENGRRVRALCNFVVSGSIRDLLMGVEKVSSRQTKKVSSSVAPDLLIRSLSVAGSSGVL